jgi:hypothetical protein
MVTPVGRSPAGNPLQRPNFDSPALNSEIPAENCPPARKPTGCDPDVLARFAKILLNSPDFLIRILESRSLPEGSAFWQQIPGDARNTELVYGIFLTCFPLSCRSTGMPRSVAGKRTLHNFLTAFETAAETAFRAAVKALAF